MLLTCHWRLNSHFILSLSPLNNRRYFCTLFLNFRRLFSTSLEKLRYYVCSFYFYFFSLNFPPKCIGNNIFDHIKIRTIAYNFSSQSIFLSDYNSVEMTHSPELSMLKCYDLSSCYRESWRISSISNIKIKVLDSTLLFYFILFPRNIIFNHLYSNNKSNVFLKRKHWQHTSFLRWGHFIFQLYAFLLEWSTIFILKASYINEA